jgi:molybdopterin/thiamine biosynthesis adenylyltransferase
MQRPRIKPFLRIYTRAGEPHLYIGIGPRKSRILDATAEMIDFVLALDGKSEIEELRTKYLETDAWLGVLDAQGVLEDAAAPAPALAPEIASRWSRQINYLRLFDRVGWDGFTGQERISNARVVVLGTGAGGTTLLRLLNAAGVGRLEAVDFDSFAWDNLPTHATLDEEDAGSHKLEALRRHLFRQNSTNSLVLHDRRITSADDIVQLVQGADFFFHAYDRPREQAIHWSNEASLRTGVPYGNIGATDVGARVGPVMVPGVTACMDCIGIHDFDILRQEETACLTGSTVAMLAGIAVNDVIGYLSGARPTSLLGGRSLYVNTEELTFTFSDFDIREDCATCGPYRKPESA